MSQPRPQFASSSPNRFSTASPRLRGNSPRMSSIGKKNGGAVYKPKAHRTKGANVAGLVNASVTVCRENTIYAFGGFDQYTDEVYNRVLKLDLQNYTWSLVENYGDIPCVRMGHTATYWRENILVIFGGENDQRQFLSDIYFFNTETSTWSRPLVNGIPPRGRSRHAVTLWDDRLFVVGGFAGGPSGNEILDDICYLDLRTMTWSQSWSFVSRFDHQCWVWEGKLWVFGGLTHEMDRTSELVWLDISNAPNFTSVDEEATPSCHSHAFGSAALATHHLQSRSHLYPPPMSRHSSGHGGIHQANIASSQISESSYHLTSKPIPQPPGATASIKFTAGANIPSEALGTHFHHLCGDTLLDFITPANTIRPAETSLSALDLKSFTWRKLADGPDIFVGAGYRWHYLAMSQDSTNAYLLGCPSEGPENEYLSDVLPIDLKRFGMTIESSEGNNPTVGALGGDFATMFDIDPAHTSSEIAADFIVKAIRDEACVGDEIDNAWISPSSSAIGTPGEFDSSGVDITNAHIQPRISGDLPLEALSTPIHVHRLILAARWPHFKRLYNARMAEYHHHNLYIPEPYTVVRAFLYYLYSDSIARSQFCPSLATVAGLLVLSNIYHMPRLRALCVGRLTRELDVESAAIIWERAGVAGEEGLRKQAAKYCLTYWGRIVRTKGFRNLSREGLVGLCAEVDLEGRVVNGGDVVGMAMAGEEPKGGFGHWNASGWGNGSGRSRGRVRLGEVMDDDEDVDGEDVEAVDDGDGDGEDADMDVN